MLLAAIFHVFFRLCCQQGWVLGEKRSPNYVVRVVVVIQNIFKGGGGWRLPMTHQPSLTNLLITWEGENYNICAYMPTYFVSSQPPSYIPQSISFVFTLLSIGKFWGDTTLLGVVCV